MKKFELFNKLKNEIENELKTTISSFKTDAKKSEFYYEINNKLNTLNSKLGDDNNFYSKYLVDKAEDESLDDENYFKKIDIKRVEILAKQQAYLYFIKWGQTKLSFLKGKNKSTKPIIWNEKKGNKIVYTNFIMLAYGIVTSEKYFYVKDNNIVTAVEELAQFFGLELGKGWNSTLHNSKSKGADTNIFDELKTNYLQYKKPKEKIKVKK